MGKVNRSIVVAAALAGAGAGHAAIVDIDARYGGGVTIALDAGTYRITLAGVAGGGQYDGWNPWSFVQGCDPDGGNCDTGYYDAFGYDLGGPGGFDRTNVRYFSLPTDPGNRNLYDTPAHAWAVYRNGMETLDDNDDVVGVALPVMLTLDVAQQVNFYVGDSTYGDNVGGVSLDVSPMPVPEPAAWLAMVAGFGLIGAAMRPRTRVRFA